MNARLALQGDPPSPFDIPSGCRFHPRCPYAVDACRTTDPALGPVPVALGTAPAGDAHVAACIRADDLGDVDPLTEPAIEPDDPDLTRPDVLLEPADPAPAGSAAAGPAPAAPDASDTLPHHQEEGTA